MQVSFRQGIITYPVLSGNQNFLLPTGNYVTFNAANGRTDITFAHKDTNYLLTESVTINNAWGPVPISTDAWLYWDIDLINGQRTFGFTLISPVFGPLPPPTPTEDQHWFDTTNVIMKVYINGHWREKVRVFAAKVNNGNFSPLGSILSLPYAGTQVGLTGNSFTGRIVFDNIGKPIRRSNNTLFTTVDQFFVQGSPVNTIKLEANILQARAAENMASFHIVKWSAFDTISLANYNDLNETLIGMLMEDVLNGNIATVVTQGVITNPFWNWTTVGAPLWVQENGELTDIDPNTVSLILYPKRKPPIARVLSPTQIFFDQGLGGKGEKGDPGDLPPLPVATTTVAGVAKLSVPATNPADPIVVGTNDPRLTGAPFAPATHTHAATQITVTPYTNFSGPNSQLALQQLDDAKVDVTGDTMTGFLTLNADPTAALHAATKQYVDNGLANKVNTTQTIALSGDVTASATAYGSGNITLSTTLATVPISKGGTGQTTQTAAFNALAPTTTKGDLIVHDGTNNVRLPVGTNGQVLTVDNTTPQGVKWATASGSSLQLYAENPFSYIPPFVGGVRSVAIGSNAIAYNLDAFAIGTESQSDNKSIALGYGVKIYGSESAALGINSSVDAPAEHSIALGHEAYTRSSGALVFSGGKNTFSDTYSQTGIYHVKTVTTDNTPTEMFIDGYLGTQKITFFSDTSAIFFEAYILASTHSSIGMPLGTTKAWKYRGVLVFRGATQFLESGPQLIDVIGESPDTDPWTVSFGFDSGNFTLEIFVTGDAVETVLWTGIVKTVEQLIDVGV